MSELRLQTRLEHAGNSIVVHYRVENNTPRDAYLLNRVSDASMRTRPDLIYIDLDHASRIVHTFKKIPDIPRGINVSMPTAPYVTPLRAGQTFEESVHIPLPIREFRAYTPIPQNGREVVYLGLTFTLGYYWTVPGMKEQTQQIIPGVDVTVPTPPPRAKIEFGQLSSAVMPADLQVVETY